ncbi:UDP-N-acetylmuramate dehydrogenase [Pseudoflavonifractor capillosus]|uniref:UDP-N-acetylmuramate dehydrogenase n=1 Tax=Pseudoflavonifractor capillosus TaxID=106588 RepID=UPI00195B8DBD|nr:UDP-N-acetylmuramate dehydrogenase [Pseudoflavonifractor capillosus]MBM6897255.1 UDP-N-acetylmuramate dehydrogenase [Pseudoflavonifractor capillosus]
MNEIHKLYGELQRRFPGLDLRLDEPMSRHTTFRVGGPAALMACPRNTEELVETVKLARELEVPTVMVGNGSNLLVDDGGVNAFVVKTVPQYAACEIQGEEITAQAGILLSQLANRAAQAGLTGLEFAQGIPGSLGGGVTMNAGAYGGEMVQVVRQVGVLCPDGTVETWEGERCDFRYRHSAFSDGEHLVLWVKLGLQPGDQGEIQEKMRDYACRRREKQPLEYPSAGSTFKRPEGHFAAALIDQCGLKGLRVGGAMVSEKHAGFVINAGGATCSDILHLMEQIQSRVHQATGVELEPEVRYLK